MRQVGVDTEADRLFIEVEADLARCGYVVKADQLTHEFLDRFVLITRR